MKVAILTTDNREAYRAYHETIPHFAAGFTSLLEGFARRSDVEVHIVSCTQRPMVSPEKLAKNIWFHSVHVPKTGWLRTGYQGCIRAVRRKLKELKPDIVHGQGTERDCAISAVFSGFPNVIVIQGNMAEMARLFRPRIGSFNWLAARLENFALRRTDGVLCNSLYTENLIRERTSKTWLAPHAIRLAFFDSPPGPVSRPCVLLSAGVVSPRKRQLELLAVAETLHQSGLKFELRFIGFVPPEPYAATFLEKIKSVEGKGYARFMGTVPENELVSCYDTAAGVIHFPTEEAFGNVVGEALARNLKFFGADLGGIKDIAREVPGAELFARDDWAGLTDALARWIKAGHPRPEQAAEVMRQRYHPEVIAQRQLDIYREALRTCA